MTEVDIRKKAAEGGLSVKTADSMVQSSRVADRVRSDIWAKTPTRRTLAGDHRKFIDTMLGVPYRGA